MALAHKIARNTFIQIFGKIISTALGLFTLAYLTRYLGLSGYGEYTTIITFLGFMAMIADLGLTLVTANMISEPGADETRTINGLFTFRLFSALIFIGIGPLLIFLFPYELDIKFGVLMTSLAFIFIALNQILVGLFQRKLTMIRTVLAENFSRLILLAGIILVNHYNGGLKFVLVAFILSAAGGFFWQLLAARKFIKIKLSFDYIIWRQAMTKSWPLALNIIFNLIYLKADTLILSMTRGQGEVGIYGAAYKIIDVLTTIPFIFCGILLPVLTSAWAENRSQDFKKILNKAYSFIMIIAIPLIVGAQFLAKNIMVVIAGEDFAPAGVVLQILVVAAGLVYFSVLMAHSIIAAGAQKKMIPAYIFTSITAIAAYFYFIPRYSYIGAAWVTIYSEAAIALFMFYYAKKIIGFKPRFDIIHRAGFSALLMAIFLWFWPNAWSSDWKGLLLTLIIAGLIYLGGLYKFKALKREDFNLLFKSN